MGSVKLDRRSSPLRIAPESIAYTILLGVLAALPALSIDISAPTLVLLQKDLATSSVVAGLTLSLFMGGFALGQLAGGRLSDRGGRRPVLLAGLVCYTIASVGCALSPTGGTLVISRFVQGLGAGACSVLSFAMVQDLFEGDAARTKRSYVTVIFGVVPMQLVFFVIVAAIAWFVLSMTNFGFRVFAVGGSAKAARVSGIHVNAVKIWAFILMGALAAFAGILSLAFLPSGQAGRTGLGLELDVIAATIVGGSSLSGGEGTILGTILGVLIIGVMRNGLVLMGVSPFVQEFMIGLVIVIAVGIDKWSTRRSA